mmetsp:Transcript_140506/g.262032  ORF Transcript_140506/g.262032 Transcript_140506/m.262032 type:complete len:512 (-) Transcript_140506:54-1589(-)
MGHGPPSSGMRDEARITSEASRPLLSLLAPCCCSRAAASAMVSGISVRWHGRRQREREPTLLEQALMPDTLVGILGCLGAKTLGVAVRCSRSWRSLVNSNGVWRQACELCWADKQLTPYMKVWLQEPPFGSRAACSSTLVPKFQNGPHKDTCKTWKHRYAYALRDSKRNYIFPGELCEDVSIDLTTGKPFPRRWHLHIRFDRWQDKEVIFAPEPSFGRTRFNINTFRRSLFEVMPWRPCYSEDDNGQRELTAEEVAKGFPMLRVASLRSPLHIGRSADWGFTLKPMQDDNRFSMSFMSRQLSATEHWHASRVNPELWTIYLRAWGRNCRPKGPHGSWEVAKAFQGTMPARSWYNCVITFSFLDEQRGNCCMMFRNEEGELGSPIVFDFFAGAGTAVLQEGHLDLYYRSQPVQPVRWMRGPNSCCEGRAGGLSPLVLLIDSTFFYRGERGVRPVCIPEGLPTAQSFWTDACGIAVDGLSEEASDSDSDESDASWATAQEPPDIEAQLDRLMS